MLNSTPMVDLISSSGVSFTNLWIRLVFPAPHSPAVTNLKSKSYAYGLPCADRDADELTMTDELIFIFI